jgi:hypothetical protein
MSLGGIVASFRAANAALDALDAKAMRDAQTARNAQVMGAHVQPKKSPKRVIRDTLSSCMERHAAGDVARRVVAALRSAGYSILPTAEPGTERVPHAGGEDG